MNTQACMQAEKIQQQVGSLTRTAAWGLERSDSQIKSHSKISIREVFPTIKKLKQQSKLSRSSRNLWENREIKAHKKERENVLGFSSCS